MVYISVPLCMGCHLFLQQALQRTKPCKILPQKQSPELWTRNVSFWFRILYVTDTKHCVKTSLREKGQACKVQDKVMDGGAGCLKALHFTFLNVPCQSEGNRPRKA